MRFGIYTGVQPFCPSLLQTSFTGGRLQTAESLWTGPVLKRCGPLCLVSALVLVLTLSFGAIGLGSLLRRGDRLPILALLLLAGLYGVYGAMTVLGRMNLRPGPPMLTSNSYYTYTALLLLMPLIFGAWLGTARMSGRLATLARKALVGGLAILAFAGAERIWQVNREMAPNPLMKDMTRPIRAVNLFVKEHRDEPDFSIAIDYKSSDKIPIAYGPHVTDTIFHRWIADEPKYWLAIRDGKAILLPGPPQARGSNHATGKRPTHVGQRKPAAGGLVSRPGGEIDHVPE